MASASYTPRARATAGVAAPGKEKHMTLLYYRNRNRLCLKEEVTVTAKYQGKEIQMPRQLSHCVRVTDKGKMNEKDFVKFRETGQAETMLQFHKALKRLGAFSSPKAGTCEVCGGIGDVRAVYDSNGDQVRWFCPVHTAREPKG